MTDRPPRPDPSPVRAFARLADDVLPALIARLDVSDLGELEVRHDGWRVRLRRDLAPLVAGPAAPAPADRPGPSGDPGRSTAISPAVGYFAPHDRTPVGHAVAAGDVLGWVEVLGVRQEVVAPCDGVVGRLLAESGQAVEYGQELVAVDVPRRAPEGAGGPVDAATAMIVD